MVGTLKDLFLIVFLFSSTHGLQQTEASITGRLLNRDGSPAVDIRVMARSANDPSLQAGEETVSFAQTDATGRYRLENVPPGRYIISAGIVESPSYYPGVAERSHALAVTLTAG